jgi:hypothetical protein
METKSIEILLRLIDEDQKKISAYEKLFSEIKRIVRDELLK